LYGELFDVILITETWLKSALPNSLIDPNNQYTIVRCDRQASGGGVCAFIRKSIRVTEIICAKPLEEFDMCCFDILYNRTTVRFINVYRPPDCSPAEYLVESLCNAMRTRGPIIITGDFNCPDIDWDRFTAPRDGTQDKILDFFVSAGFSQLVKEPARGNNILDVVCCNEPLVICNLEVLQPLSTSDHSQVTFTVSTDDDCAVAGSNTLAHQK
jgi:hypothetical protein